MGLRIEQRAREILKGLQQLNGDFGIFRDSYQKAQRHLNNAQSAFVEAGERAERLGDRLQQFASVAAEPSTDKEIASGVAPTEDRVQTTSLRR